MWVAGRESETESNVCACVCVLISSGVQRNGFYRVRVKVKVG